MENREIIKGKKIYQRTHTEKFSRTEGYESVVGRAY